MRDIKIEAMRCITIVIATAIVAGAIVLAFSIDVVPVQYGNNKSVVIVDKVERTIKACESAAPIMLCGPGMPLGD